ncbi:MAG: pyridoxamine 5'-phosphate oxidase family protein [Ruminococcaceae bacterium]|nr:pyridoxamine 5'-phosphate oxidase family protein [Oscillospiraceae bacterium]
MEKTAAQIQKERQAELERNADKLVQQCDIAALTSVNEKGYPRTCILSIAKAEGFKDIYFISSKRSDINGKVTHFEKNPKASVCCHMGGDSVTLIGNVEFIQDKGLQEQVWSDAHSSFFKKGTDDPKFRLIKFHTIEATFWIGGKFRTCKYK